MLIGKLFAPLAFVCALSQVAFAQVPTISSFTPASGPVGIPVTISGSNFNSTPGNNIVYFGAVKATVTNASTTSLTVTVPAGATQQSMTVLNTANGLTGSFSRPFKVTFPSSGVLSANDFDPRQDFAVGTGFSGTPNGLTVGDVDGDNKIDIIAANNDNTGPRAVYVMRNTSTPGALSFNSSFFIPINNNAVTNALLRDMDGDGKLDLVLIRMGTPGSMGVYRNTSTPGNISFAAPLDLMSNVSVMGIQDFDGDGRADIITDSNSTYAFRNLSTPGTIAFSPKITVAPLSGSLAGSIFSFYDLNGDGKMDMIKAATNVSTGKWVPTINLNTSIPGTISFGSAIALDSIPGTPGFNLNITDYDGDGKPDISGTTVSTINPYANSNLTTVWKNTGSGSSISFAPPVQYSVFNYPLSSASDDFDGDGKMDIVTANANSSSVSILRNTATSGILNSSSFSPQMTMNTSTSPIQVHAADFDGDGKPDIAGINSYTIVWIFRNHPAPIIAPNPAKVCEKGKVSIYISSPHAGASAYQWQIRSTTGSYVNVSGAPYTGGNTDTLKISNPPASLNGSIYRCAVVTNGVTKYSGNDTLQVSSLALPVITRTNLTLSTGAYLSYQWYRNDTLLPGATNATYTVTRNGSYTVVVFNAQGCSDTAKSLNITNVGIHNETLSSINIYPNPATSYVMVNSSVSLNITIRDISGRLLIKKEQTKQIDVHSLPAGIYLIYLYNNENELLKTEKLIIGQ